jgi:hypothetical protein
VLRFYLIATIIVLLVVSAFVARRGMPPDLRISQRVVGTPTPTVGRDMHDVARPRPSATFSGDGSWVMSALPGCFDEQSRTRGSLAALRAKFPPAADRLAATTILQRGNCTIAIGENDIIVTRGPDRLHVPPLARLYAQGPKLTLVVVRGTRAEIRVYGP